MAKGALYVHLPCANRRKVKMKKTGKVMGIIIVMLIAFFSASFIATSNASGTSQVTIYNGANQGSIDYKVDNVQYSTQQTFTWTQGSTHTIQGIQTTIGNQLQLSPAGDFYVDGSYIYTNVLTYTVPTHDGSVFIDSSTKYGITFNTNGIGSVTPSGFGWYDQSSIDAVATPTNPSQVFTGWTFDPTFEIDDPLNPAQTVYINGYGTVTANFYQPPALTSTITITNHAGTGSTNYKVDNIQYSTPQIFTWEQGSIHTITGVTTINGQERYVPTSIDSGITQPTTYVTDPCTYTVPTYDEHIWIAPTTQYAVNFNVNGLGTVTPSGQNWINPWANITISATPAVGQRFTGWTATSDYGDVYFLDASAASTNVSIGDLNTVITANFAPMPTSQITINNNQVTYQIDGSNYYSSNGQVFNWIQGSTHTITTSESIFGLTMKYTPTGFISPSIGSVSGNTLTYTVPTTNEAVNIASNVSYWVTVNANTSGSVSPSGSTWYSNEQRVPITATPNTGYTIRELGNNTR